MGAIARFFAPFHQRGKVNLMQDRGTGTAEQEDIAREAEAEIERVEEDDKYFGRDTPASQDELLSPVSLCFEGWLVGGGQA